jgi:hypothetical protein
VACVKCHTPVGALRDEQKQPELRWKPLEHRDCAPCHKDPHGGRLPGACDRCHTDTRDFLKVITGRFDHDKTRYPLRGRHRDVPCARCHDPGIAGEGHGDAPPFAHCTDCHHDDHHGTATLAKRVVDCDDCHDVNAFKPSTYTVAMHAKSNYALLGRHATTACAGCHPQVATTSADTLTLGRARVRLRPPAQECNACHGDPHKGRFVAGGARVQAKGCAGCHDAQAFRPSHYDLAAHAHSRYPLEGAHEAVSCRDCHKDLRAQPARSTLLAAADSMRTLAFADSARVCASCHEDVHAGQFAVRKDRGACEGCHDVRAFTPAERFSHERDARFALTGDHSRVPCARCHFVEPRAGQAALVRYRPVPMRCEDCHKPGSLEATHGQP